MKKFLFITIMLSLLVFSSGCDKSEGEQSALERMVDTPQRSKNTLILSQISSIENAINSYFMDNNEYPEIMDQLIPHYLKTESHIIDPWGTPFTLENDENLNLYLISAGRDTIFGTEDDFKRRM
ncbi:MAG: type II secretion system protein GspG [Candidatus Aminicenantes bacterium]|nr:type II secretion system protein GspG [Candidatus Aminicenantes bacterium]